MISLMSPIVEDPALFSAKLDDRDTWATCATNTVKAMGFAVASMLSRQNNLVKSPIDTVKEQVKKNVNNADWLDYEIRSRLAAIWKTDEMMHSSIGTSIL